MANLASTMLERMLGYGKNVILLNERVESLQKQAARLDQDTTHHDRRLVRLETIFDIAQKRFLEDRGGR